MLSFEDLNNIIRYDLAKFYNSSPGAYTSDITCTEEAIKLVHKVIRRGKNYIIDDELVVLINCENQEFDRPRGLLNYSDRWDLDIEDENGFIDSGDSFMEFIKKLYELEVELYGGYNQVKINLINEISIKNYINVGNQICDIHLMVKFEPKFSKLYVQKLNSYNLTINVATLPSNIYGY